MLIESIAFGLLYYYEVKRPPVPVLQMLRQPPHGLEQDLDFCPVLPYGEAVYVRLLNGQGVVFVNPALPPPRQRYVSAREMLSGLYGGPRGRALGFDPLPHQWRAQASDYFARCLLMPKAFMPRGTNSATAAELAELFGVPMNVAKIRVTELDGRVPDS
ncbi:MAG: ImmA/IrrE family metallo-endopeptidase [Chloroflexi bacterium]|nr:ImmA/IrrE family metallo-endopeptidase [Chloroflexota bacterium]